MRDETRRERQKCWKQTSYEHCHIQPSACNIKVEEVHLCTARSCTLPPVLACCAGGVHGDASRGAAKCRRCTGRRLRLTTSQFMRSELIYVSRVTYCTDGLWFPCRVRERCGGIRRDTAGYGGIRRDTAGYGGIRR